MRSSWRAHWLFVIAVFAVGGTSTRRASAQAADPVIVTDAPEVKAGAPMPVDPNLPSPTPIKSDKQANQSDNVVKGSGGASGWLRDHFTAEWLLGCGGWRTGISSTGNAPGFEAWGGGGEVSMGFEIKSGIGLVLNGRGLIGRHDGDYYIDGKGGLALQLAATTRLRIRIGVTAGLLRDGIVKALSVGGFLAMGIDLVQFRSGRSALVLGARLDVDGHPSAPDKLPGASLALACGFGVRY